MHPHPGPKKLEVKKKSTPLKVNEQDGLLKNPRHRLREKTRPPVEDTPEFHAVAPVDDTLQGNEE